MSRLKSIDRERILDAAEQVALESGAHALTLDNVAAQASISKGGLTYTFGTKDALLVALLDRDLARLKARVQELGGEKCGATYPELRGLIEAGRRGEAPSLQRFAYIVAALTCSPTTLDSVRSYIKWMMASFASETPADRRARSIYLATQGMFLLQGLGLLKISTKARRALLDDFQKLIEDTEP